MKDVSKTKQTLIEELASLRQRILELEQSEAERKKGKTQESTAFRELQESEEKYRQVVENAHDYIICMDLDGIIRYVNRAVYDLVGPINLIGLPAAVATSPDQLKRHYDLLQRRREGDVSVYSFEWEVFPPGSDRRFIMDVRSSALMENGKPSGVLMIARDVTDRKYREEELRAAKEKYRMLVEGVNDLILEIDHQGVLRYCSPIGKKIWGYDAEDVIGKNFIEFVYPDDQDPLLSLFPKFNRWMEQPLAFRVKTKSGEVRWARASMSPRIENGRFMGAKGILIDITEQKRLETALRNSELLFKNVFSMSPVMMGVHRLKDGMFLQINRMFTNYTGYQMEEIIGRKIDEFAFMESASLQRLRKVFSEQHVIENEEIQYKTKTGELRYGLYSAALIGDNEEKKVLGLLYDITERKRSETLLQLREEEFRKLAKHLEEANIALRVVLSHREEDQKILEEKIQCNMNEIILPFLGSLKSGALENRDKHYLGLLESNLKSILSPFMKSMSNTYKSLTPKEKQIAEMIREGKNSKDIADMLGTSVVTINTHRNNIRKKLNMKKQKTNLRSYLLSLS